MTDFTMVIVLSISIQTHSNLLDRKDRKKIRFYSNLFVVFIKTIIHSLLATEFFLN